MRKELFDELVQSVKEMKEIQAGRLKPSRIVHAADLVHADTPNVAGLRARFQLSQVKFATLLGISVDTLQNWEQKRRQPDGPAKVLLRIAATHPEALLSTATPPAARRRPRAYSRPR
jgi:putative transcriptional regulator